MPLKNPSNSEIQGRQSGLRSAIIEAYNPGMFTDATIVLEKCGKKSKKTKKTFQAHKFILSLRSSVFSKRLEKGNILTLEYMTPEMVNSLLWYIYNDELNNNSIEFLVEMFYVAKKYDVKDLPGACVKALQENFSQVSTSTSNYVLKIALEAKNNTLIGSCLSIIEDEDLLQDDLFTVDKDFAVMLLNNYRFNEKTRLDFAAGWLKAKNISHSSFSSSPEIESMSMDDKLQSAIRFIQNEEWKKCSPSSVASERHKDSRFPTAKLHELEKRIKESTLKMRCTCPDSIQKITFFGTEEFEVDILFSVHCVRNSRLLMLQLAFGASFVPVDHLSIRISCSNEEESQLTDMRHQLIAGKENYCIVLDNRKSPSECKLGLKLKAFDLRKWKNDSPASSLKYRIALILLEGPKHVSVSNTDIFINVECVGNYIALVDPVSCKYQFIVKKFYFDTTGDFVRYLRLDKTTTAH